MKIMHTSFQETITEIQKFRFPQGNQKNTRSIIATEAFGCEIVMLLALKLQLAACLEQQWRHKYHKYS